MKDSPVQRHVPVHTSVWLFSPPNLLIDQPVDLAVVKSFLLRKNSATVCDKKTCKSHCSMPCIMPLNPPAIPLFSRRSDRSLADTIPLLIIVTKFSQSSFFASFLSVFFELFAFEFPFGTCFPQLCQRCPFPC